MTQAAAIECTSTELLYLASLRGGQTIIGINDPLRGLSTEDVESALLQARDTLATRRVLALGSDGRITLDYDVARVVDAVARPRHTFFTFEVTASAADAVDHGRRRVIHLRGSVAVEVVAEAGREPVVLVPLAGLWGIGDAVLAFWAVADQTPARGGQRTTITQRAMHAAAREAAQHGAAHTASLLLDAGAGEPAARALAETLSHPRRNAALLAFEPTRPGQTTALGMLEGDNGLWRLRPLVRSDVPLVELQPCSGDELAETVRSFVSRG